MKKLRQLLDRIPRPVRVFIDLLLIALLLQLHYIARGSPAFGEEARFRRAEKAGMVGPSELIDRMFVHSNSPSTGYNLLLIGDDGDSILFYTMRTGSGVSSMSGKLIRREKADGILLTTLPTDASAGLYYQHPNAVPLLLFADDPAALRAQIRITLSGGDVLELSQVRGDGSCVYYDKSEWMEGCVREKLFLCNCPVTPEEWESDWMHIAETNASSASSWDEWQAEIGLYDAENRLIRSVDYVIRSRAGDAAAAG